LGIPLADTGRSRRLTDPRPTEEVYLEQYGERPVALGYGSFEAFRIFPMSPAESWQMLQQQGNDLQNLTLDPVKQSVMPVAKVVRGRQVELEALKKRGQGTAIMVNSPDDVTFGSRQLEMPTLAHCAGQFDLQFLEGGVDRLQSPRMRKV
jgi:hypothetical protein